MKLSNIILEADYWDRFKPEAEKLEQDLNNYSNKYKFNVTIIAHSRGDKAMGKVTVKTQAALEPTEWQSLKNYLSAYGFEDYKMTQQSNFYDEEEDKIIYPSIKFEFSI